MHFGLVAEPRMRNFKFLLGIRIIYFPCYNLTDIFSINSKSSIENFNFSCQKNSLNPGSRKPILASVSASIFVFTDIPVFSSNRWWIQRIFIKVERRSKSDVKLKIFGKMASNQTIDFENLKQSIKNFITNWFTTTLQALETSGDVTNPFESWEAFVNLLIAQVLQILEENGIETEALVNAANAARSQSSSDTEIQESMDNLQQQAEEIFTDARIQELGEELRVYYDSILNHQSLTDIFGFPLQIGTIFVYWLTFAPLLIMALRSDNMAEVKEKFEEFLTKFLEVETALNDQHD
jgi:hypothetical protein